jgi:hypothetical protein
MYNGGLGNVNIGHCAGWCASSGLNVMVGYLTGLINTAACNNFFGYNTGRFNTTGTINSFFGTFAGYNNASGSCNTAFGSFAGCNMSTGSNVTTIGYDAQPSSGTVSNEVTIGNGAVTSTRLRGLVATGSAILETFVTVGAATGTINYDVFSQSVYWSNSNATGNWTLNIRGNSTTSLNSVLAVNQSISIAFIAQQGATAYYQTGFQIDGSAVTPKWQTGVAPASGNANSNDMYVITILKTGSAAYTVFETQTKFGL